MNHARPGRSAFFRPETSGTVVGIEAKLVVALPGPPPLTGTLVLVPVSPASPLWGRTPFPKTIFVDLLTERMTCARRTVDIGIGLPADAAGAGRQSGQTCWFKEGKALARWTRWWGAIAAVALLALSGPVWAHSHPLAGTPTGTAPLSTSPGPGGCNGAVSQGFKVSPGSNLLSGCPTGDLEIGTYSFPWTMYVDVAGNYSTAEYTQVTWKPGTVSSGAYAWYGELTIYKSNTSTGEYHYYNLECKGVRYTNETFYPDHSFSFGSVDIIAEQFVWMDTSSSCGDQISGTPEFTIYH